VRSGSDGDADASRAGTVVGTPAYMAPEQAAGQNQRLDERVDVFGLGAILCEILSGAPPYDGGAHYEVIHQAARGDTAQAWNRLDACGADAALIALAKDCLASDPSDRPKDAGEVARRITAYLAGVQEKLRSSERERAVAEARAGEEEKRHRLTLALALTILELVAVGGGGTFWYLRNRERQAAQVVLLTDEARFLCDQARAHAEDPAGWRAAREAVRRVEVAMGPAQAQAQSLALDRADRTALDQLRSEVQAGLDRAESDRLVLERLVDIHSASADDLEGSETDAAFAAAFVSAGIDVDALTPSEAGARIARRPEPVARALVAALDQWTAQRYRRGDKGSGWTKLVAATRAADPDPDRDALRAALLVQAPSERLGRLRPLAQQAGVASWTPASLVLLGNALAGAGDLAAGVAVLRRAAATHPGDAWVHYDLGRLLEEVWPPQSEEAIRAYTAARAVRPELAHELAHALEEHGRDAEAEAVFRDLILRRPGNLRHLACLGVFLNDRGRNVEATPVLAAAVAAGNSAIRRNPDDDGAHYKLGDALVGLGKLEEGIAQYHEALRLNPDHPGTHNNLGNALRAQGKLEAAIAEFRTAIRLKPNNARAHHNLAMALRAQGKLEAAIAEFHTAIRLKPDGVPSHTNLGNTLSARGKLEEAIAEYREAIRLKPDGAIARYNLGNALMNQGKLEEALAEYNEAIRLDPDQALYYYGLAGILDLQGNLEQAVGALRTAIRLKPDYAEAHTNLGKALKGQGNLEAAIAEYQEAIRLNPDLAEALCNLGLILLRHKGDHAEALTLLRRGHELGSQRAGWRYPSAEWVRQAERAVALEGELPAILKGEAHPSSADEWLALGRLCMTRGLPGAAARFYAEAFAVDPEPAEDLRAGNRYNAASAAALAGCGQGKDDPPLDESKRAGLRQQAREWLAADLAALARRLDAPVLADAAPGGVVKVLSSWKSDRNLAGVRAHEALEKLPSPEQEAWRSLWAEVDALLGRVRGDRS
jgi:tetratricopeptide (TPR) repeat protein